jgi:hypothetical protein
MSVGHVRLSSKLQISAAWQLTEGSISRTKAARLTWISLIFVHCTNDKPGFGAATLTVQQQL